ncbi:hypothetical protein PQR11_02830 [Paraburkholderia strydomiana]|uniref:hypothetical protein n=1 Tax=Paraburkholderia strydomiana TaxID=1245417 RepID=UPI0038BB713B
MDLLARTEEFGDQSHDGRFTLRMLSRISGVREILMLKCDRSPHANHRRFPKLSVLATVASISGQPLHRVIRGQLLPWRGDVTASSITTAGKDRSPPDWTSVELELKKLADYPDFANLNSVCRDLKASVASVRNHFPDLLKQISTRKKILQLEKSKARRNSETIRLRQAFRTLIEAGSYPSSLKLAEALGFDRRDLKFFRDVIDEEWIRAEKSTAFKRKRCSLTSGIT